MARYGMGSSLGDGFNKSNERETENQLTEEKNYQNVFSCKTIWLYCSGLMRSKTVPVVVGCCCVVLQNLTLEP